MSSNKYYTRNPLNTVHFCPNCNGTGYYQYSLSEDPIMCPCCGGSGYDDSDATECADEFRRMNSMSDVIECFDKNYRLDFMDPKVWER